MKREDLDTLDWVLLGVVIGVLVVPVLAAGLSNSGPVNEPVPLSAPSGPTVIVGESGTMNLTAPFPDANTVDIVADFGNGTFVSSGDTNVTVPDLEGAWTNLTALNVTQNTLEVNPADKQKVEVLGDASTFNFSAIVADDGNADLVVNGSGTTTITANGLDANQDYALVESDGTQLAEATADGNGQITWPSVSLSKHVLFVQSTTIPITPTGTGWCDRAELEHYLTNFTGQEPLKAVACPFVQNEGAGMGLTVFALFFYGFLGLGMTVRTQHPGPMIVAGMLTVGVITLATPGIGARIIAIVLFFGVSVLGLYLYQKAQSSL